MENNSGIPRILVAGIGNILLGDDGFGVVTARRLAASPLAERVQIVDFGIRGMDLVYALLDPYDSIIFIDLVSRGECPGTLYLIEPETPSTGAETLDTHGMDPVKVLALAGAIGAPPARTFLVGCEPGFLPDAESIDVVMELSPPVQGAVVEAVQMVERLVEEILTRQDAVGVAGP